MFIAVAPFPLPPEIKYQRRAILVSYLALKNDHKSRALGLFQLVDH
jgi:hypothetical protein